MLNSYNHGNKFLLTQSRTYSCLLHVLWHWNQDIIVIDDQQVKQSILPLWPKMGTMSGVSSRQHDLLLCGGTQGERSLIPAPQCQHGRDNGPFKLTSGPWVWWPLIGHTFPSHSQGQPRSHPGHTSSLLIWFMGNWLAAHDSPTTCWTLALS